MGIRIKRVGVLGAGVMGQGIAAHLANAGIPSYLFDVAPGELTDAEAAAGLTLEDRKVRNRISDAGVTAMKRAKPALLYRADLGSLVTACNYEDDLDKLGECDWIVEVVVERMDIKQRVFEMVDEHRRLGSVVSSNTSGLSVEAMAEGRSEDFKRHFMVTHFFNPVRYMRLLELVPIPETDPDVFAGMAEFGERVLGKGIVYCKDTPNFIANRIGTFGIASVFHWMAEYGVGVAEADALFGPTMGRAKSAVFRTADIVGLDTMAHVLTTIAEGCPDDPWRDRFTVPESMQALIADGRLGAKTGAGFYKKVKGEKVTEAEAAGADFVGGDDFVAKINEGWLDFDTVIATPDMMGQVGRLGRVLGPRGLMPNPKVGTVSANTEKAVTDAKSGQVQYRIDKAGIIHCPIGRADFEVAALKENLDALLTDLKKGKPASAKGQYVMKLTVSSTMGPGVSVDRASVDA